MRLDACNDLLWQTGNNDEIIFEKIEIVNEGAGQFCRRTDAVREPERVRILLSWWATPLPIVLLIPKRLLLRQLAELLLWLPFLPAMFNGDYSCRIASWENLTLRGEDAS